MTLEGNLENDTIGEVGRQPVKNILMVNEIFTTIQGEGPNIGKSCTFVRLAGCNLRCIWCDTKYTWLYSDKTKQSMVQTLEDLNLDQAEKSSYVQRISSLQIFEKSDEIAKIAADKLLDQIVGYQLQHVVITGGEPLLQKSRMASLIQELFSRGFTVEIETNGTISPSGLPAGVHYNVSPKLSNSINPEEQRIVLDVLKEFKQLEAIFKFVIESKDDAREVVEIIESLQIDPSTVYLMPQASTREELLAKSKNIVSLCLKHKYNYSHRLHIELYDGQRGV